MSSRQSRLSVLRKTTTLVGGEEARPYRHIAKRVPEYFSHLVDPKNVKNKIPSKGITASKDPFADGSRAGTVSKETVGSYIPLRNTTLVHDESVRLSFHAGSAGEQWPEVEPYSFSNSYRPMRRPGQVSRMIENPVM